MACDGYVLSSASPILALLFFSCCWCVCCCLHWCAHNCYPEDLDDDFAELEDEEEEEQAGVPSVAWWQGGEKDSGRDKGAHDGGCIGDAPATPTGHWAAAPTVENDDDLQPPGYIDKSPAQPSTALHRSPRPSTFAHEPLPVSWPSARSAYVPSLFPLGRYYSSDEYFATYSRLTRSPATPAGKAGLSPGETASAMAGAPMGVTDSTPAPGFASAAAGKQSQMHGIGNNGHGRGFAPNPAPRNGHGHGHSGARSDSRGDGNGEAPLLWSPSAFHAAALSPYATSHGQDDEDDERAWTRKQLREQLRREAALEEESDGDERRVEHAREQLSAFRGRSPSSLQSRSPARALSPGRSPRGSPSPSVVAAYRQAQREAQRMGPANADVAGASPEIAQALAAGEPPSWARDSPPPPPPSAVTARSSASSTLNQLSAGFAERQQPPLAPGPPVKLQPPPQYAHVTAKYLEPRASKAISNASTPRQRQPSEASSEPTLAVPRETKAQRDARVARAAQAAMAHAARLKAVREETARAEVERKQAEVRRLELPPKHLAEVRMETARQEAAIRLDIERLAEAQRTAALALRMARPACQPSAPSDDVQSGQQGQNGQNGQAAHAHGWSEDACAQNEGSMDPFSPPPLVGTPPREAAPTPPADVPPAPTAPPAIAPPSPLQSPLGGLLLSPLPLDLPRSLEALPAEDLLPTPRSYGSAYDASDRRLSASPLRDAVLRDTTDYGLRAPGRVESLNQQPPRRSCLQGGGLAQHGVQHGALQPGQSLPRGGSSHSLADDDTCSVRSYRSSASRGVRWAFDAEEGELSPREAMRSELEVGADPGAHLGVLDSARSLERGASPSRTDTSPGGGVRQSTATAVTARLTMKRSPPVSPTRERPAQRPGGSTPRTSLEQEYDAAVAAVAAVEGARAADVSGGRADGAALAEAERGSPSGWDFVDIEPVFVEAPRCSPMCSPRDASRHGMHVVMPTNSAGIGDAAAAARSSSHPPQSGPPRVLARQASRSAQAALRGAPMPEEDARMKRLVEERLGRARSQRSGRIGESRGSSPAPRR